MIWTIYNHGTGASSLKSSLGGEIVNLFGNNDRTPEFQGKIITEGVGSIGDPKDLVQTFGRTQSGTYFMKEKQGSSGKVSRFVQTSAGTGVKENVNSTLEFIRALNLAGHCPTQINMLGWSRGAVTCIRIAYQLSQSQDAILRNIPIQIFAVDPVAGFGHNTEVDATTINANVRNYVATMATGEQRFFFKPIVAQRLSITAPGATRSWIVPMPGVHNQTANNNNFAGKLTFDLAFRFLTACGTNLTPITHYKLSEAKAWSYYEALMLGKGGDQGAKTTQWKGALTTRKRCLKRPFPSVTRRISVRLRSPSVIRSNGRPATALALSPSRISTECRWR